MNTTLDPYLNPPRYIGPPEARHACATRRFQGIPGVERAPNGRLWAAWYGGGITEDHANYILLATCEGAGKPWTPPGLVIDPDGEGPVRAFDPCLWHDPTGRLWLFWSQGFARHAESPLWGVWAITTRDSGAVTPDWTAPVRLCDGILMNKPTVLAAGDWLLPVARWHREGSAGVVASVDGGNTWAWRGAANVPDPADRNCDEHMLVERRDGTLWMLVRTKYGIGESVSTDRGCTWPPVTRSALPHTASRFFIRRLRSGRLLLVKHGGLVEKTGRSHLTAFLSEDDGQSWKGGLLLDERQGVSYPDGVEAEDGTQVVIYDFDRRFAKEINLAVFHERAVLSGKPAAIVPVNRAHGAPPPPARYAVVARCGGGPLLTTASHPSLGTNLNGPCVIRVPEWVKNPRGRYYLYFAHHQGKFIRMAYADAVTGPYTVYEPGVLDMAATPFNRHIASPEVQVDHAAKKIVMLYHGGGPTEPTPSGPGQYTAYAESADGLRFVSDRIYLSGPYLRTFFRDGWWYGLGGGADRFISRSRDLRTPFEAGPRLEIEGESFAPWAPGQPFDRIYRTRHVAFHVKGDTLWVYYSNVGDTPERIKRTAVALAGDWMGWKGGPFDEVLRPEKPYEGVYAPLVASEGGSKHEPVHELRDPYLFEEAGRVWMFYSIAGEQGLALAEIKG